MSLYLKDFINEVENCRSNDNYRVKNQLEYILPAICNHIDVDIAHRIIAENYDQISNGKKNERKILVLELNGINLFNAVVWESCSSRYNINNNSENVGNMKNYGNSYSIENITQRLMYFATIHFKTPKTVSVMNQMDLGCLAVWLSSHSHLFSNNSTTDGENSDLTKWNWKKYKDVVVSGLLNVLNSRYLSTSLLPYPPQSGHYSYILLHHICSYRYPIFPTALLYTYYY